MPALRERALSSYFLDTTLAIYRHALSFRISIFQPPVPYPREYYFIDKLVIFRFKKMWRSVHKK
jgi:hypothetical protein